MKQPANQYPLSPVPLVDPWMKWWSTPICKPTVWIVFFTDAVCLLFEQFRDALLNFAFISCLVSGYVPFIAKAWFFNRLITVLLTYIWTFSGFSAWHLSGGHYTFAVYLLAPWACPYRPKYS